jgi:DNA-binding GntR family transcriptional regulator
VADDTLTTARLSGPNANTRLAYEAIRKGIGNGEFAPGTWLRESGVASTLDLSRTPVREALRMLASEGVVELVHNRGARVVSWSADDIDEVYRLRALLEGHGAALAAQRTTPDDLDELMRLEDRFEAAARRRRAAVTAECNNELHAAVVRCSRSPRLATLLDVISSAPLVTQAIQRYAEDDVQRSIIQHRDILNAIAHRDSDLAETAMRSHILAARYAARRVAEPESAPIATRPSSP